MSTVLGLAAASITPVRLVLRALSAPLLLPGA
jgi:hypothetical protein